MASTYSTNLALELMGTGDQAGTWGTTTNTNLGTLIEQAISGVVTQAITDGVDTTITIPNGATGVARNMYIEMTGALTAARNMIVPANKKLYFIYNNTTGGFAVTVKVSGQTGVSVPNGAKMILVMNSAGTDVVSAVSYFASLTLGSALPVASGGTGSTSVTANAVVTGNSGGTGFSSVAPGTNGNVLVSNGTNWTSSVPSVASVTGTLGVGNGGTGATSLTANNVLLGNGTSALQVVAPGTAGNILTSNGTTWASSAPAVSGAVTVRQTVSYGALDTSGRANHLSAGSGLNFNISATATPLLITYANGGSDSGTTISADASNQGSLTASTTNFIYSTYASTTSVTWGSGIVPPQYGYTFDKTQNALLNFEGSNGATTTTDDFGNAWTLTSATISTTQFKFGASSLSLSGTTQYAESTAFTSFGGDSWEVSLWFRATSFAAFGGLFLAENGTGYGFNLSADNNAGTPKIAIYGSFDGSANGIVTTRGTTTLSTATWYKVRVVFDAVGGSYKVYLSNNGAAESLEITVSSTSRICAFTKFRLGSVSGQAGTNYFTGYIDAFRFMRASSGNATTTPSASAPAIGDYPVHWFSIPEMKMYEATTASGTSGTNPTFTQRNRVFHGEADAGASTVSAVRNYAYQGRYRSALQAIPAASTRTTFSHNIGVDPQSIKLDAFLRFVTNWNGYTAGMVLPYTTYYAGTNPPWFDPRVVESALVASVLTNFSGTQIQTQASAPNSYVALPTGSGTAQLFVTAERNW